MSLLSPVNGSYHVNRIEDHVCTLFVTAAVRVVVDVAVFAVKQYSASSRIIDDIFIGRDGWFAREVSQGLILGGGGPYIFLFRLKVETSNCSERDAFMSISHLL